MKHETLAEEDINNRPRDRDVLWPVLLLVVGAKVVARVAGCGV